MDWQPAIEHEAIQAIRECIDAAKIGQPSQELRARFRAGLKFLKEARKKKKKRRVRKSVRYEHGMKIVTTHIKVGQ